MARTVQRLLVDVQNTLHGVGALRERMSRDIDAARDYLAAVLSRFPRVWMFEDGGPQASWQSHPGVMRMRSSHGDADDALIEWLQQHPEERPATVVTADRDLALRARAQGCRILTPVELWRRHRLHESPPAAAADPREQTLSTAEVEEWMRLFGVDEDEDPPAEGTR